MGFGLLFIGYLFTFSLPYHGFDVLPDIIGFIISYVGLRTLAEYGCGFDDLKKYFSVLLPAGTLTAIIQLLGLFKENIKIDTVWNYVYTAFLLVYNILLLVAIYRISNDTELMSLKAKAKGNLYLGVAYYVIMFIMHFPIKIIIELNQYLSSHFAFGLVLYIFGYIWSFLNLILIFNCYMWICKPGDEDMPIKEKKSFVRKDTED